jgi:hypothetical protein
VRALLIWWLGLIRSRINDGIGGMLGGTCALALKLFVNYWNGGEGKEIYADQKKLDDELDRDGIIP